MDNVEESKEDIDGDDFEGVKDNRAGFHVVRAGEAGLRLHKISAHQIKGWSRVLLDETSMKVLAEKK